MKTLLAIAFFAPLIAIAAGLGDSAVVLYNSSVEDSKAVASHYLTARGVPANQVIGLPLPAGETMTRQEFREQLQEPLLKALTERGLYPGANTCNSFESTE